MATGVLYLNDRDIQTDFGLAVDTLGGFPGILSGAPREVPIIDGPEMQGGVYDPRLMRRRPGSVTVRGILNAASVAAAMTALDALRETVLGGELAIRTGHASDRHCLAVCTNFEGEAYQGEALNGRVGVSMSFTVKDGVAVRIVPDTIGLSSTAAECAIGTAECWPVILVHGGGAALTNPVVTLRDDAGDIVQAIGFTVSLSSTQQLRIDSARATVDLITAGVVTDALAAGYWTSGDFPVLRPYDANVEAGAFPTLALSSSTGTPIGEVTYTRRYA